MARPRLPGFGTMGAAGSEDLGHQIVLGYQEVPLAVPVRERGAEAARRRAHVLTVGAHAERRVVVHELVTEVFVHRSQITPTEQTVDELGDELSLAFSSVMTPTFGQHQPGLHPGYPGGRCKRPHRSTSLASP